MDLQKRLDLISQVGEEIVTTEELKELLRKNPHPVAYDGFEPSGFVHIAAAMLRAININKMTSAGCRFKMLVADWHAWANNKMGGSLENIQLVGEYLIEVWKACGMDLENVEFVWVSGLVNDDEYWKKIMQVARNTTVNRIIRCGQIMGRKESEVMQASQILYPCMQAADIFHLKADICQLGMDQRKVNMLAREIGPKLDYWKPVVVSHHMLSGLLPPTKTTNNLQKYSKTLTLLKELIMYSEHILQKFKMLKESNFASDKVIIPSNKEWIEAVTFDVENRIFQGAKEIFEIFNENPEVVDSVVKDKLPNIISSLKKLNMNLHERIIVHGVSPKIQINERAELTNTVKKFGNLIKIELWNEINEERRYKFFENKMSKSKPDSAIFMTDAAAEVERKIMKAYCPEKETKENPILEYCRYIIFEKFKTFNIERPSKFGGNVSFEKYAELEKAYVEGKIHPADLKKAVAIHINKLLDPVRKHFEKDNKARELLEKVSRLEVTR